jgi:putative peptidoglycan lipid II flippase
VAGQKGVRKANLSLDNRRMYLRAGLLSLGLLIFSRVLGLLRESAQAAAFGATGLGDAVIVMFTLPDLLVGIFFSGALAYVLLPAWSGQSTAQQNASQRRVARVLFGAGVVVGALIWLLRDGVVHVLAPGLQGAMRALAADSLGWSAAVLPLALLAALWVTRLQHERDFVGMYTGNLLVNFLLVLALFLGLGTHGVSGAVFALGCFLLLAMLARLAWLAWRLRRAVPAPVSLEAGLAASGSLPGLRIWAWAALSSGFLLLLPLVARSLASQAGEGALANFNYAWKLVELPLVLAIQLVASLAFPAVTRTEAGSPARAKALQVAFLLAWTLACAAIAVVGGFSLPLATLLFGWGRMDAAHLQVISQWSAIGIWSLLPQALVAVLMTVMAANRRMHLAAWAYAAGAVALVVAGVMGLADGATVMWALNGVLVAVAAVVLLCSRSQWVNALPWPAMFAPLAACGAVVAAARSWGGALALGPPASTALAGLLAALVLASALAASPLLRGLLRRRALHPPQSAGNN